MLRLMLCEPPNHSAIPHRKPELLAIVQWLWSQGTQAKLEH
jgi:hypothetical protein